MQVNWVLFVVLSDAWISWRPSLCSRWQYISERVSWEKGWPWPDSYHGKRNLSVLYDPALDYKEDSFGVQLFCILFSPDASHEKNMVHLSALHLSRSDGSKPVIDLCLNLFKLFQSFALISPSFTDFCTLQQIAKFHDYSS